MMVTSRLLILAGVESIRDRHYAYSSCDRCYSKVLFDGDTENWICIKCRSNRPNVLRRYRMNFRITDSERLANVTVFGHNLDKFFGCTADEFYRNLESLSQTYPQLINENLIDSVIDETFVGSSFLFGFKLPNAQRRDNAGNLPSSDLTLPNEDGSSFPSGLPNSEEMVSGSVAWQMLFPCSDNNFTTVLTRLRQIVSDFGSSQCLNSVIGENLLLSVSGFEGMSSLSQTSCVERDCIGTLENSEQSLVLSCDQDVGSNVEPKELNGRRSSGFSSVQSLRHMPGTPIANSSFLSTATHQPISTRRPRAPFETMIANTQFSNVRLSQHRPICSVSKGSNYDSGFCSEVVTERNERVQRRLNDANDQKSNGVSELHVNSEPRWLKRKRTLDKESPNVTFDESSIDEIEICRAASVVSQERRVFMGDFSFKRCVTASSVSQEITKKLISKSSPSQLDLPVTLPTQKQSCTLDFVEAPYSEDLEAFLKDCEFDNRLTCETLEVPASNSKRVGCRLKSISHDSLSESKDRDWEQPYSEDLDEFLKGDNKFDEKQSQVRLKPLNSSSVLQQTPSRYSFTTHTVPSKHLEPRGSSTRSLDGSGCSNELFSLWSDDFEQQVAESSIPKSLEKSVRHCVSQQFIAESSKTHSSVSDVVQTPARCCILPQLLTESLRKHSSVCIGSHANNLWRNSSQLSPYQSPLEQFSTVKTREIRSDTSLNESKENVEPSAQMCYASDTFDSSLSILFGQNKNFPHQVIKSTRKTTLIAATPPVIGIKNTPRLHSFLNYRTPVNTISSANRLLANSFSSKGLHEKLLQNCATRKSVIVLEHSTKKARNGAVATPVNNSFDLFQSPHFIHTGLPHRQSGLRADFPGSVKFPFSSTPLSTTAACTQSPMVVEDFSQRLVDCNNIAANPGIHQLDSPSSDCLAGTFVHVLPHPCALNSYRNKAFSRETSATASDCLTTSISPELFGNSSQRPSSELSPCGAVCSWITVNRKDIPIECNLFNSPRVVSRASTRDNNSGLHCDQSKDLFGDSGDLFLD